MEKNELKKELMKNRVMAELSHYCAGNLYYKVATADGMFQFPIATIEVRSDGHVDRHGNPSDTIVLSSDLGSTAFNAQEKASMLWRWIDKAIDAGEYVKVA